MEMDMEIGIVLFIFITVVAIRIIYTASLNSEIRQLVAESRTIVERMRDLLLKAYRRDFSIRDCQLFQQYQVEFKRKGDEIREKMIREIKFIYIFENGMDNIGILTNDIKSAEWSSLITEYNEICGKLALELQKEKHLIDGGKETGASEYLTAAQSSGTDMPTVVLEEKSESLSGSSGDAAGRNDSEDMKKGSARVRHHGRWIGVFVGIATGILFVAALFYPFFCNEEGKFDYSEVAGLFHIAETENGNSDNSASAGKDTGGQDAGQEEAYDKWINVFQAVSGEGGTDDAEDFTDETKTDEREQERMEYRCTGEGVNVRSGPGADNESIGKLASGQLVEGTGETEDGWIQIIWTESDGEEGWVSGTYLESAASPAL